MKIFSFGVLMLSFAIFGSLPRTSVLDFAAGNDPPCGVAVGLARCNSIGFYDCNNSFMKCNVGDILNAFACEDGAGNPAEACVVSPDCAVHNHALVDYNCVIPVKDVIDPPVDP